MNNNIKALAICGSILALVSTVQAQTAITSWGLDSANAGGWTLTGGASGNFTVGGAAAPSGNTVWFGTFTPVTLSVGQTLEYTGSLNFSSGSFAGGLFRIGAVNYTTPGTLSSGIWTGANQGVSGYMLGIPTGGAGIGGANPSEVTGHTGGAWYSSNNGYSVPGGLNNNAANATANTFVFDLKYTLTSATVMTIDFSFSNTGAGGSYSEVGTAVDNGLNAGNVATTTFNGLGFFANGSDTAISYTFNNVSQQVLTPVPEPASMTLLGLGALVGTFLVRRNKK